MKASTLSFRIAVVFAILGFIMGIAMAATGNHSVMPAHAHLNLLGWVSMFLFGSLLQFATLVFRTRVNFDLHSDSRRASE